MPIEDFDHKVLMLGYGLRAHSLVRRIGDVPIDHPYAPEIRRMFAPRGAACASAVFLHGGTPLACLIDDATLPSDPKLRVKGLREFCERLWNQNLASVVLVVGSERIEAHSVLDASARPDVVSAEEAAGDGPWSEVDLTSGRAWERKSAWFDPKLRVDTSLLENIVALLKHLCGSAGLNEEDARDALAKVIFVAFLEQRGVLGQEYRERHGVQPLLTLLSEGGEGSGLRNLFSRLRKDFNGDFLDRPRNSAKEFWELPPAALLTFAEFLQKTNLTTGQRSFWAYDFAEIPIELISAIYQTFLATKGRIAQQQPNTSDEQRGGLTQRELGAYYTPRNLANYVVEQAFAGVTNPLDQTIFDGTCGSGILLTTAYTRLLRIAQEKADRPLTFDERRELLVTRIFGSDIDPDASRLTVFSLYLALLSELQPPDLARIQRRGGRLPRLIHRNLRAGPSEGDVFTAATVAATRGRFSLVISNPPWREPAAEEITTYEAWIATLQDAPSLSYRQIAIAYTFRALDCLKPGGRLALVLPARLIVGERASDFRVDLTERMHVERIVNFSDMRRLIFPGAVHPFAVVSGSARDDRERAAMAAEGVAPGHGEVTEYLVPKADVSLAFGRLAIHGDDRIELSTEELYSAERILGLRYWGTEHDVALYRKCRRLGTLRDLTQATTGGRGHWLCNSGWVAPYKGYPGSDAGDLAEMLFLDSRSVPRRGIVLDAQMSLRSFPKDEFPKIAFFGERELYKGPRILWPDGVSVEHGIKAFYTEASFNFRHSLKAIGGNEVDRPLLRFLATYLRSRLAQYLLILRSHTIAGERPKLPISDLLAMPFVRPETHPSRDTALSVLGEVNSIFNELVSASEGFRDSAYLMRKDHLDALVMDYFLLEQQERVLVKEMVERVAPSIQPSSTSPSDLLTPLLRHPTLDDLDTYCRTLETSLEKWRTGARGKGAIRVTMEYAPKLDLAAARIELLEQEGNSGDEARAQEITARELVWSLGDALTTHVGNLDSSAVLTLPRITVATGRTIRLVKPFRVRFWLQRAALADADRLVQEIRASASSQLAA